MSKGTPTADASRSDEKIKQRLKFKVKIIFFDAAIGSKSYADLDKTRVKLFPNFTRHHLITHTKTTPNKIYIYV